MNKEQLDKIIALREALEDAYYLLGDREKEIITIRSIARNSGSEPKQLQFIKSALLVYCDKLKEELKGLGYEE